MHCSQAAYMKYTVWPSSDILGTIGGIITVRILILLSPHSKFGVVYRLPFRSAFCALYALISASESSSAILKR